MQFYGDAETLVVNMSMRNICPWYQNTPEINTFQMLFKCPSVLNKTEAYFSIFCFITIEHIFHILSTILPKILLTPQIFYMQLGDEPPEASVKGPLPQAMYYIYIYTYIYCFSPPHHFKLNPILYRHSARPALKLARALTAWLLM